MSGFGKVFAGLYEGSMLGAGVHVFALWPYCIARSDAHGNVEVNPRLAAVVLGCSIPEVESALDYLQRPDPESRSKAEDGRRLLREGQFAYRIVNYLQYREIRDAEARREYQREWDRTNRPTRSDRTRHAPTETTKGEAEAEAEAEAGRERRSASTRARSRRVKPTEDEWVEYAGATWPEWTLDDVRSSWSHYEARKWKDITDWKAAAKTCRHRWAPRENGRAPRLTPPMIGAHKQERPTRDIGDAPEEIRELHAKLRRREATDDEVGRLDAWVHGGPG